MEIIVVVWNQYLYIPLYNFLVWLYLNYSFFNLGTAVIILTVILRIALLPFTILVERSKIVSGNLETKVKEIQKDFANDPIKQRQAIRMYLKKNKIRPWAKAVVLGVQGLVLVLLYQVFLGGINSSEKLHLLYTWVPRPDFINTKFLWFDIAQHNLAISLIVAAYIFVEILIDQWESKIKPTQSEQLYSLLFPAAVFAILFFLPSVKALFILTSLIFSSIISVFTVAIKKAITKPQKQANT